MAIQKVKEDSYKVTKHITKHVTPGCPLIDSVTYILVLYASIVQHSKKNKTITLQLALYCPDLLINDTTLHHIYT